MTPSPNDPLLAYLTEPEIDRDRVRGELVALVERLRSAVQDGNNTFGCYEPPPDHFVVLSKARFTDNYMSTRAPDFNPVCAVVALGNWKRSMAPPSVAEFFLVLLLRHAVAFVSPALSGSVHIGTKGCLFDFNRELSSVRFKVLGGFVCSFCTNALERDGHPNLRRELVKILSMRWLSSLAEPFSVASVSAKLGHNLFIVKGLTPTIWEAVRSSLPSEGLKQILGLVGTVLAAAIGYYLGFSTGKK